MFEDHKTNQRYIDYIQPLNQDIFTLIHTRMTSFDKFWYEKKILDYGCNNANLLKTSRNLINQENYVGIDVQQKPLSFAKSQFQNAEFIYFNGFHVAFNPLGEEKFPNNIKSNPDIIICHGLFTHCDMITILETLDYFKSIVKKPGHIIFSIWEDFHLPQYVGIFLKNKLKINVPKDIYMTEYNKSFYLINREYSIIDTNKLKFNRCNWIETFYKRNYLLENIPGIFIPDGSKSKHSIVILPI